MIRWICLDVGETIFDETGLWSRWARFIDTDPALFRAALRGIVTEGRHHREVFDVFCPGFDIEKATAKRIACGDPPGFLPEDIFPDVRPALDMWRKAGIAVGVAGNTSQDSEQAVVALGLPVGFITSSASIGANKPNPAFFAALVEACGVPASEIAYVGDRLDNDVLPACAAGMRGIWLRRGLWAETQSTWPEARTHADQVNDLTQVLSIVSGTRSRPLA